MKVTQMPKARRGGEQGMAKMAKGNDNEKEEEYGGRMGEVRGGKQEGRVELHA